MYDTVKDPLKREIHKYRVSLTTDTLTSVQNLNYMVLTAHFVDDEWNMHKRILNFYLISSHEGKQIGKLIEQCLVKWEIENVMCISFDNALANKVAIEYVVRKMQKWPNTKMIMNSKFMHVRCLAHIINLVVKDGLKRLDTSVDALRNAVRMYEDDKANIYSTYFKENVLNDEGEEVACKGRVGSPKEEDWDGAEAFERMYEDDKANIYSTYFREKAFYLVTLKVSASKYPTSNTAVHDVITVENEIEKLFLPEYMQTGETVKLVLRDMTMSMRAKY
ncbi:zinc finger BED domain-containing protein RICESLEEPER 3-like [Pyrus x bretschneideri]|uniref:zinc finger BED domain-containing protein RICESLEEPER 3-like n=1 Tax=Pyrus x bretschneideri TaxID=225117 RepID=UPI00202EFCCE|nr:zinc finger BED domain-containing protein RICESLEEPER 3-like [Pyrus x bretschneideri]